VDSHLPDSYGGLLRMGAASRQRAHDSDAVATLGRPVLLWRGRGRHLIHALVAACGGDRSADASACAETRGATPAAFGLLVVGGAMVFALDSGRGLTLVAISMLALHALALRYSWSIAVTVISPPPR
jgi:hypothetical protein